MAVVGPHFRRPGAWAVVGAALQAARGMGGRRGRLQAARGMGGRRGRLQAARGMGGRRGRLQAARMYSSNSSREYANDPQYG